jgi:DNA-binding MarR family transcriptional regulator
MRVTLHPPKPSVRRDGGDVSRTRESGSRRAAQSRTSRRDLVDRVALQLGREFSAQTVLFHQAIAARLGLSGTDHKCLDVIQAAGRTTSTELARATGLTSGAITGVVDRLERQRFVRRVPDPSDRRRIFIEPVPDRLAAVAALFEPLSRASRALVDEYDDAALEVIEDFLTRAGRMLEDEAARLRR